MTKDRLADLRKVQPEDHAEINDNTDVAPETVALTIPEKHGSFMEDFFEEVKHLNEMLEHIQEKTDEVKKLHTAIISSPSADESQKQRLDDLTADIKKSSGVVRKRLKDIEKKNIDYDKKNPQGADTRIRKGQHASLLKRFMSMMNDYNMQQVKYRDLCHDRIHRQLQITGQNMSDEELEEKLEKGDFSVFTQGIIMEKHKAQQMLQDIKERHLDIVKLENSLREINELFQDLAMLVSQQGEMIDNIERNVVDSRDYVTSAIEQLDKAREHKKSATKLKIIIITVVTVVVLIIVLSIVLSFTT